MFMVAPSGTTKLAISFLTCRCCSVQRSVMGREVVVAITEGKLHFGPWEQIFYGEFDGKRAKRVLIKILGE